MADSPGNLLALQQSLLAMQEQLQELQEAKLLAEQCHFNLIRSTSTLWLLGCGALVYFMQAGFALVEVGTCRLNNAVAILVKNQADFLAASCAWFFFGWGVSFGDATPTLGFAGTTQFLDAAILDGQRVSDTAVSFHFQQMFCSVAATIVSGGIAERAHLKGYVVFSFLMSSCIYPFVVCWCWNGDGWLASRGFSDFAGSGVVHLTGGMGALAGAWVLGPRLGRFISADLCQDAHEFHPHNVPFVALGTMILQLGWYGFNAGSTLAIGSDKDSKLAALASVNTTLAAISGGLVSMLVRLITKRKWDVPYVCNGILTGLVSITASCNSVAPMSAVSIGGIGALMYAVARSALSRLRIDDPVGAFLVHGFGGIWGVLAVPLFQRTSDVLGEPMQVASFEVQLLGVAAICAYAGGMSLLFFSILKRVGILSSSAEEQRRGLDRDYGGHAYGSKEVSRYRFFVCHAKSTHGATARWLQLELAQYARGRSYVFLDSDNLVNLAHLLGTVREKVDVLVVVASKTIWWRPWCAGEITVASEAGVPILLLMMQEDGQPLDLDFVEISRDVRTHISQEAMDTLAPFGLDYDGIEMAYSRLSSAQQVPLGAFSDKQTKGAILKLAGFAHQASTSSQLTGRVTSLERMQKTMADSSPMSSRLSSLMFKQKMAADSEPSSPDQNRRRRKDRPTCLVICDKSNMEAVSASRIVEKAMLDVSHGDSGFRAESCTGMSEAQVLRLVAAGVSLAIVLSEKVLENPLVQQICLVRATALWPDGFAASAEVGQNELGVLIHADHLGFQYPSSGFYEDLKVTHDHLCRKHWLSDATAPPSMRLSISVTSDHVFDWSNIRLPYEDDQQAAVALTEFYKRLFHQIAMPFSTHGSWKAIRQQIDWIYERSAKLPCVPLSVDRAQHFRSSQSQGSDVDVDHDDYDHLDLPGMSNTQSSM